MLAHSPINQLGNQLYGRATAFGLASQLGLAFKKYTPRGGRRSRIQFDICDGEVGHPGYNIVQRNLESFDVTRSNIQLQIWAVKKRSSRRII